ncbi:hypothetical protein HYW59_04475 [Candidatus Kaiserbacteria bacterium]|nr:hypothetical protein [Candidatus Kaiserbacteria bacterium]
MGSLESEAKGKGKKMSRRSVLQGLVSTGTLAAMPTAVRAASYKEWLREREKQDEAYFQKLVRDPNARKRFQEAPTGKELGSVMRSLAKAKAQWIEPFKQDEKRMHGGALTLRNERGAFIGNGTLLKVPMSRKDSAAEEYHYLVATTAHVADMVPPPAGTRWTLHPKERDVAVRELSALERASVATGTQGALLFRLQDNRDITGEVGAVIAHDNDRGSLERKLYPSRISPTVSGAVTRLMGMDMTKMEKYTREPDLGAYRVITLPSGEAKIVYKPGTRVVDESRPQPARGVSGSAFVHTPRGATEPALGGIFVGALPSRVDGDAYDAGFVIDRSYIGETITEHLKRRSP